MQAYEMFYLSHVTRKRNANLILKNGFKIGKHSKNRNLWLGDGVYFWDGNDKSACKMGYKLVRNKDFIYRYEITKIDIFIKVEEIKYFDLDLDKNIKLFEKFLNSIHAKFSGKELISMIKLNKEKLHLTKKEENDLGFLMGKLVNAFIKKMKLMGVEIDMFSYSFYKKSLSSNPFHKKELYFKQYCIKNVEMLNEYIIHNKNKIMTKCIGGI